MLSRGAHARGRADTVGALEISPHDAPGDGLASDGAGSSQMRRGARDHDDIDAASERIGLGRRPGLLIQLRTLGGRAGSHVIVINGDNLPPVGWRKK